MKKIIAVVAASMAIAACSSTSAKPSSAAADPAQKEDARSVAAQSAGTSAGSMEKSVYFDFNQFVLKPEFADVLKAQAAWLKSHPGAEMTLEGNTDERGSTEYNLALGSKRADSVRRGMVALGIPASRMKEVSFGETRPKATCDEEKCWHENRRVDFDAQ